MNPSNFDDLTKALASSTSRRQALRTILTASVGGLLGIGGISTAFGRHHRRKTDRNRPSGPKGNRDCAKFCAQVFGPNTSAAGQCTNEGAHGRGLCFSPCFNDPSSVCCVRPNGPNGFCRGTSPATCCGSNLPNCCGGTCAQCCDDTDCPSGQSCQNGTCVVCTPDCTGKACGSGDGCGGICQTGSCPGGQTCQSGTCVAVCIPICASTNGCGNDGCGGSCGSCPFGQVCDTGQCVTSALFECVCANGRTLTVCQHDCSRLSTVCGNYCFNEQHDFTVSETCTEGVC